MTSKDCFLCSFCVVISLDSGSFLIHMLWPVLSAQLFFFFFYSRMCSQARGQIGAPTVIYTTATATPDPSHIHDLHHMRPRIEPTSLQTLCHVLNPLIHNRNSPWISGYLCLCLSLSLPLLPPNLLYSPSSLVLCPENSSCLGLPGLPGPSPNSERLLDSTCVPLLCAASWKFSQGNRLKHLQGSPHLFSSPGSLSCDVWCPKPLLHIFCTIFSLPQVGE